MNTLKKCIVLSVVSFLGVIAMICPAWDIWIGMTIWGLVLLEVSLLFFYFGGVDNEPLWMCLILNAIGINFGGYLIILLLLRVYLGLPIPIGGI